MRKSAFALVVICVAVFTGCAATVEPESVSSLVQQESRETDYTTVVEGLQIRTFGQPEEGSPPIVLIFLHGDSCQADYMTKYADRYGSDGVVSIVMARPGCFLEGRRSAGSHGSKDYYTRPRIEMVATAILSLKEHYATDKVFLVGHSGGAATAGIILGLYPGLVQGITVVGFPANIPRWRIHRRGRNNWKHSLSPHTVINSIDPSAVVFIVSGEEDSNTPPFLANGYVEQAKSAGVNVEHIVAPGQVHNRLMDSAMTADAIATMIWGKSGH